MLFCNTDNLRGKRVFLSHFLPVNLNSSTFFLTGNIDPFASNKCDPGTGVCNACINNAAGDHCENCKEGFFGNAKNQTCESMLFYNFIC